MQNNNKRNSKAKGYYILLAACALVIGVSGYVFLSDAGEEQRQVEETALSIPMTTPEEETSPEKQPAAEGETAPTLAQSEQTWLPVSGDVVQNYAMDKLSYNATTRDWRTHGGVDLAAELGQEVRAAKAGTVMAVYEDDYYGMTVVLQHTGGYTTSYCGLTAEIPVSAGEEVAGGQVIGTVGDTALIETAMDSHLHFEVCKNGEQVDPASFLY